MVEASANVSDPSTWTAYGIPDLLNQVEEAHTAGQYLFIWDKSDNIDTFFKYKGFLIDFYFLASRVEHQRIDADEAIDALRSSFVKAGRQGQHLLVNLNDSAPDFINTYTNPAVFAVDTAFNHAEWRKPEVHMAVLKEGENYSANAQASGLYYLQPDFTMQIRTTAATAEAV